MINTSKLNELQKKDFNNLRNKLYSYSYYDALTYLNDYIYELSDSVNSNYFKCIIGLKDYYYDLWIKGLKNN